MSLEAAYIETAPGLLRRLERMTGDPHTAEDLCQEAFARAWTAAPRDVPAAVLRSWLYSTAGNLAVDELRRRSRQQRRPLAELDPDAFAVHDHELPVARAALAELTPHERLVLLLRYQAGLSLRELARLLDVTEEAARKRVARARERFREVFSRHSADPAPLVLLVVRDVEPDDYVRWLEQAGARVQTVTGPLEPRNLLRAEAVVVSGSHSDVHPATYGERPRFELQGSPDARRDRRDLAAMRTALAADVPLV
ncbi:MAG TPA: sigma-70 family RNA polymerase sigma factor, partial [Thermoleophilaceae bacterium]